MRSIGLLGQWMKRRRLSSLEKICGVVVVPNSAPTRPRQLSRGRFSGSRFATSLGCGGCHVNGRCFFRFDTSRTLFGLPGKSHVEILRWQSDRGLRAGTSSGCMELPVLSETQHRRVPRSLGVGQTWSRGLFDRLANFGRCASHRHSGQLLPLQPCDIDESLRAARPFDPLVKQL